MLRLFFLSTVMLVVGTFGLPPVMIKQPVAEVLFKVSPHADRQKPFDVQCEAEGDPMPK